MFIVGYFIRAVASLLDMVIVAYIWIIIARALLSWVSPDPYNPIVRFLYRVTEPVLRPVRERLGMMGRQRSGFSDTSCSSAVCF